jgi:spermidine synthase
MAKKKKSRSDPWPSKVGASRGSGHALPWLISQSAGLKLLVFTAGAVLMGLEIAGSRILAPHFGNSVFVWGSLISVFLIALSIGYYVGGKLADRQPSQRLLSSICIAVSTWIFLLAVIGHAVCETLVRAGFGEQSGPLLASAILFLPPSVAMGMVSPFSIRIAATGISSLGQVSGTLYALSTAGSIVGTLLTTFVLIPMIGVGAILRILGIAMLLISVITLPFRKSVAEVAALMIALLVGISGVIMSAPQAVRLLSHQKVIHDEETPYHRIFVIDDLRNETRQLRFDQQVESGISWEAPHGTTEKYIKYFQLAFLLRPQMERVLFIGAGGGVGPRTFAVHDPKLMIEVVDIDERVLAIATDYFHLKPTPRMKLIGDDGRMYLRKAEGQYDCIVLDAFTIGGRIPFHLVTREFLELCREKLTSNGIFMMNMGSALEGPRAGIFRSMNRTATSVFPTVYLFARDKRATPPTLTTNVILIASKDKQELPPGDWMARAERFESKAYIQADEMQELVGDVVSAKPDETASLFTDDYAPIETMAY